MWVKPYHHHASDNVVVAAISMAAEILALLACLVQHVQVCPYHQFTLHPKPYTKQDPKVRQSRKQSTVEPTWRRYLGQKHGDCNVGFLYRGPQLGSKGY